MLSTLAGRYLAPLAGAAWSRANVVRVGRSVVAALRAEDTAPLPAGLAIEVDGLPFERFASVFDAVSPAALALVGAGDPLANEALPRMVAHATAAGAAVTVVTDGVGLDAGRAHALLQAGLGRLIVRADRAGDEAARARRNAEKLVAMRDANRKPGPVVEVRAARGRAAPAPTAPCYAPWYAAWIGADGAVYPCRAQARAGASVGSALREPFGEVWNGPRLRAFRARLRVRRDADSVCRACPREDAAMHRLFDAIAPVAGSGRACVRL